MPNQTVIDGTVLMAGNVNRERPWIRLGTQVEHDMGVEEALRASGSDDHVYPVSLYDLENVGPNDSVHESAAKVEAVEGVTGVKSDKYGIMGIHSNGYTITQRREILELAYDIAGLSHDEGFIDTIGNAGPKAEKFFAYIRYPDLVIDPNGIADSVERGLYVATSFDGSLPNLIGYSSTRIACLNQLHMILKGLTQKISVRHTRNAEERMQVAARALGYVGAVEENMRKHAENMLRVEGDDAIKALLDKFYPVDDDQGDLAKTRRLRERGDIRSLYEGNGNTNVDVVGHNGWAAYNAFVEYLDHAQGVKGVQGLKAMQRRAERAALPGVNTNKKVEASSLVLSLGR